MQKKLPAGKIFCFLCNGILILKDNDKSRVLDHLQIEHRTNCNLDFITSVSLLDEEDVKAIKKIIDANISNTQNSDLLKETSKESTENEASTSFNIKSEVNETISDELIGDIDKNSEEIDTIVVDGSIIMEPVTELQEDERLLAETEEFLLATHLEPNVQIETHFDESGSEEYTPNLVEVDVSSLSENNQCPVCDTTFASKKSIKRHLKNIHKIFNDVKKTHILTQEARGKEESNKKEASKVTEPEVFSEDSNETRYKCDECGEELSWKAYYKHVRTVHEYSRKAAIKSVVKTKKRMAEERLESATKKGCWSGLVSFDCIPYDDMTGDVVKGLPKTKDVEATAPSVPEKADEASPAVAKQRLSVRNIKELCRQEVISENISSGAGNDAVAPMDDLTDEAGRNDVNDKTNDVINCDVTKEDGTRTVCAVCNTNVLVSYLRRHLRRVHKTSLEDAMHEVSKSQQATREDGTVFADNDVNMGNEIETEVIKTGEVSKTKTVQRTEVKEKSFDSDLFQDDIAPSFEAIIQQDSDVYAERLKVKLLLDSEDDEAESEDKEGPSIQKEVTEDRKTIIENLKPNGINSNLSPFTRKMKAEFDIVKDPNLPPMWLVKYTTRPDKIDREFFTPDNQRIRSQVKMLDYMKECQQYTPTEIENVKDYFRKPRVSVEHLKSLDINNS